MNLPLLWTPRQRPVVFGLCLVLLAGSAVALFREPVTVPDPPVDGSRAAELATRLDPNTAEAADLAAIPDLGQAKARAIVDYRTAYLAHHAGRPAFRTARDLLPVRGVGVSTVDDLAPYLTFPGP